MGKGSPAIEEFVREMAQAFKLAGVTPTRQEVRAIAEKITKKGADVDRVTLSLLYFLDAKFGEAVAEYCWSKSWGKRLGK